MAMPLHCGSFTAAVGRKSSFHKGTVQLLEVKEAVLEFQVIQRRSDIVSVPKSALIGKYIPEKALSFYLFIFLLLL